ncbi:YybH family protein [Dyella subtropica]|uniref:YybH family protein n=1 Tax=Dyella subtropica TaxID=2992127 RepID=UPI002250BC82|nr:nuclear transport factor 2 family protein [Dyella subtropica]
MLRPLLLVISLAGVANVHASQVEAVAQVQKVVDDFQAAILAKDAKAMDALFLPNQTAWMAALSEDAYHQMAAKKPGAPRFKTADYKEFVKFVGSSKEPIEEKFSNVRIDANDAVASVSFDFVFLTGGQLNNDGKETWQLVRTDDGWKISSMLYSISAAPKR